MRLWRKNFVYTRKIEISHFKDAPNRKPSQRFPRKFLMKMSYTNFSYIVDEHNTNVINCATEYINASSSSIAELYRNYDWLCNIITAIRYKNVAHENFSFEYTEHITLDTLNRSFRKRHRVVFKS